MPNRVDTVFFVKGFWAMFEILLKIVSIRRSLLAEGHRKLILPSLAARHSCRGRAAGMGRQVVSRVFCVVWWCTSSFLAEATCSCSVGMGASTAVECSWVGKALRGS